MRYLGSEGQLYVGDPDHVPTLGRGRLKKIGYIVRPVPPCGRPGCLAARRAAIRPGWWPDDLPLT